MEWEQPRSNTFNGPTGLRRRHQTGSFRNTNESSDDKKDGDKNFKRKLKKLDMFPKVEQDLTIKTDSGGFLSICACFLTFVIVIAEIYNHYSLTSANLQHVKVDKSLNTKMRVDLNITFPSLHCDDVHIDIMDVAGDAHNDVEDTIQKIRLHLDGSKLSQEEIRVSVNKAHKLEMDVLEAIDKSLSPEYCGPCYGANENAGDCCNHCDDVIKAYKDRGWDHVSVFLLAEQCIREGKTTPSKLKGGEGCNIAGYMEFSRVNGNFHIAMGEGVERNGQHIHTFLPDDTPNFNCSHYIHTLNFGPALSSGKKVPKKSKNAPNEQTSLNGVKKILTEENGVSGMFQYFIKIVPTTYKGKKIIQGVQPESESKKEELETNHYFVTERFTPLMEVDEEHWELGQMFADDDEDAEDIAAAHVGGNSGTSHNHDRSHLKPRSVLPGIFFIYQVSPFSVEISKKEVPLTHLLIRILATVGGAFTLVGWFDAVVHSRKSKRTTDG